MAALSLGRTSFMEILGQISRFADVLPAVATPLRQTAPGLLADLCSSSFLVGLRPCSRLYGVGVEAGLEPVPYGGHGVLNPQHPSANWTGTLSKNLESRPLRGVSSLQNGAYFSGTSSKELSTLASHRQELVSSGISTGTFCKNLEYPSLRGVSSLQTRAFSFGTSSKELSSKELGSLFLSSAVSSAGGLFDASQFGTLGCFRGATSLVWPSQSEHNWSGFSTLKLKLLFMGTSTAIVFFHAGSSKNSPSPPGVSGSGFDGKEPEDPLKTVIRMLEEIKRDMPVKKSVWIVRLLENSLGLTATGFVVRVARNLTDKWERYYFFICFFLACFSLGINPRQAFRICKYYLVEQQDEMQKVLSAYQMNSEKKPDDTQSVSVVAFSSVDLETMKLRQIQLFLRGEGSAAAFRLLQELAIGQPGVLEGKEVDQVLLLLRGKDGAAALRILEELSKGQPPCVQGK